MEREKLLATLATLHQELQQRPSMDPEAREGLKVLAQDIEAVLREAGPVSRKSAADLQGRLGEIVEQFEVEHPRITALLSQVTDLLSSMGI